MAKTAKPKKTNADIILIQDPSRAQSYAIPRDKLESFVASANTWAKISPATVTLVIPDGLVTEVTPPFLRAATRTPSILLQDPARQKSYFLSYQDLKPFATTRRFSRGEYFISFILPVGLEFIEELPLVMRELLQSSELRNEPI